MRVYARPRTPAALLGLVVLILLGAVADLIVVTSTPGPAKERRLAAVARPAPGTGQSTGSAPAITGASAPPDASESDTGEPTKRSVASALVAELDPVAVLAPSVLVDEPSAADPVAASLASPEVAFATGIVRAQVDVAGTALNLVIVDPLAFRVLTPQVTADADGVWHRLVEGDVLVDFAAADRIGAVLGGPLGAAGLPDLRVGAIVSTSDRPVFDVVISDATAQTLGMGGGLPALLVALADGADVGPAAQRVTQAVGGRATVLVDQVIVDTGRAEPPGVWDLLALCESSGRWDLDSGNGYFGGLQFLPSSWAFVGGTGLPHQHSREEQIARAKVLLAYQGWVAWPVCSRKLGLR